MDTHITAVAAADEADVERDLVAAARRHAGSPASSVALCLVDGRCRVRWINSAARRLLNGSAPLGLSAAQGEDGTLSARSATDGQVLRRAIAAATGDRRQAGAFAIGHPAAPTGWLQARALPVGEHPSGLAPNGNCDPLALLVLSVGPAPPLVAELQQLFGLTLAEAELARLLASGMRLEDCASARNVSVATVRTQLTHVLDKTRSDSQKALINIVLSLPAPF